MQGAASPGLLGPIGLGLQVGGAIAGGLAARDAGRFQQRIDEANALQQIADGEAEAGAIREQVRVARGEQIAAQAASGFDINTGSALTALRESLIKGELDIAETRRQAATRANAYRARGAMARHEGNARMWSQFFGAAASVAQGAGDWASAPREFGYRGRG